MTTPFQRAYATAITLNNMGANLLERRSFHEAAEVMNDAVTVMKEVSTSFQNKTSQNHQQILFPASVLQDLLKKANRFLSSASKSLPRGPVNVMVLSEEESAELVSAALHGVQVLPADAVQAIRLDLKGQSMLDCEMRDPALESAVLLHNFGCAHTCLAISTAAPLEAKRRMHASYMLYKLASSLFQEHCDPVDFQGNEDVLIHYLPLSILTFVSLHRLASFLCLEDEAQSYLSHITEMQDIFLELEFLNGSPFYQSKKQEGAAAA